MLINDLDVDNLANVCKYVDDTNASRATEVTSVALMRGLLSTTVVPRRPHIRLRNGLRRIESNSIATNIRSSEYLS